MNERDWDQVAESFEQEIFNVPANDTKGIIRDWVDRLATPGAVATDLGCGVGRTLPMLAERFRRYLSETPIAYLTRWRLQLGAQLLASTNRSVAEIAAEVGYESEPAFNRAFKREFDLPPARFRSRSKADRDTAARGETSSKGTRSSGG